MFSSYIEEDCGGTSSKLNVLVGDLSPVIKEVYLFKVFLFNTFFSSVHLLFECL